MELGDVLVQVVLNLSELLFVGLVFQFQRVFVLNQQLGFVFKLFQQLQVFVLQGGVGITIVREVLFQFGVCLLQLVLKICT